MDVVIEVTEHPPPEWLAQARRVLDEAFSSFTDDDWEHGLGGVHAFALDGREVVGHASAVGRTLVHTRVDGSRRTLATAYVEAVAVRASHRRRGVATALMQALEPTLRAADVAALSASTAGRPLYEALGWQVWPGTTSVVVGGERVRTPDEDGSVWVQPNATVAASDPAGDLACDWRSGDVW